MCLENTLSDTFFLLFIVVFDECGPAWDEYTYIVLYYLRELRQTADSNTAATKAKSVTAYFLSEQLLLFAFAQQHSTVQMQTAVAAYFSSEQLLLFAFALPVSLLPVWSFLTKPVLPFEQTVRVSDKSMVIPIVTHSSRSPRWSIILPLF